MMKTYSQKQNSTLLESVRHSLYFGALHHFFMGVIVAYAIALSFSGTSLHTPVYDKILPWVENGFWSICIIEIALKLGVSPRQFFKHPWNFVDSAILIIAVFVPSAKVLRVLRFFVYLHVFTKHNFIKRVVHTFIHSLPTLIASSAILAAVIVCYGLMTTSLFHKEFPDFFGHIGASVYTLFQIMTLESWSAGVVRPIMDVYPWAWIVFVSFILFTTYGITNIFIGAIVNAMSFIDEAQSDGPSLEDLQKEIQGVKKMLQEKR